jgi:hypothetical protein
MADGPGPPETPAMKRIYGSENQPAQSMPVPADALRLGNVAQVIAVRSEAIQSKKVSLDCFVAEFIIGPARGRTRWLIE